MFKEEKTTFSMLYRERERKSKSVWDNKLELFLFIFFHAVAASSQKNKQAAEREACLLLMCNEEYYFPLKGFLSHPGAGRSFFFYSEYMKCMQRKKKKKTRVFDCTTFQLVIHHDEMTI